MKKIIWILAIIVLILMILVLFKKCQRDTKPQSPQTQSQTGRSSLKINKDISKLQQELKPHKVSPAAFKAACNKQYSKKNAIKMCECEQIVLTENGLELTNYWELLKKMMPQEKT